MKTILKLLVIVLLTAEGYSQLKCHKCDDCREIEMNTPSFTCTQQLTTKSDSKDVPTTEKPRVITSTTPLPITTTTTTKIPSTTIEPISVSLSIVNSSMVQSQPSPAMNLMKEPVNYRKIEHPMVVDAIEYNCFKMNYKVNGRRTTKRGCVAIQSSSIETCSSAFGSNSNYDECMLCDKNICNNAGSITGSIFLFFVTLILTNFY